MSGLVANDPQYLTFVLAEEIYGIDILRVDEIKSWDTCTTIPNTPGYLLGIINLRGKVVPVIDLRRCFNMEPAEFGPTTAVILTRLINENGEDWTIGIVVDAVAEVYEAKQQDTCPPPALGGNINVEYISGLATGNDRIVILLDVDRLLSACTEEILQATDKELAVTAH